MHCFDEIIDRRNTGSLKYDFAVKRGKPADVLPLWVADMDFRVPPCVTRALEERIRHGIYGYSEPSEAYFTALEKWFSSRHGWQIRPEWLIKTPGVVFALCAAVRALTQKGDAVLIQQPVYYPFTESIVDNGRKLVVNELVRSGGKYSVDFEDFERKITENDVRLFILCSPHNPVGRVWTREELTRMGEICRKHRVFVVSDEIHADFTYPGHRHIVFASLGPEFAQNSMICTAPTKTFNLAGLQISNIFIPNQEVRRKIRREIGRAGYSQANVMGLIACRAAYEEGAQWLDALKEYLTENLSFVRGFLRERLPEIRLTEPEGTYLIWLDCSALGLSDRELDRLMTEKAKLWLDAGPVFGQGGSGFQRINIACPRSILEEAFRRLEAAVREQKEKTGILS